MTKVQVSVEYNLIGMDDATARAHARALVEGRGLIVSGVKVVTEKGAGKEFVPKAGKPGSVITRENRNFVVWADGPRSKELWVMPAERREGDADVYLANERWVHPHHYDGTGCSGPGAPAGEGLDSRLSTAACDHKSHERAA
jgi:hypothetical protein